MGRGSLSALETPAAVMTRVREEERVNGVRVTSIRLGYVDTAMARSIAAFEGAEYRPETYLRPSSVAAAVRLAVDAAEEAMIESLSIRPRYLGTVWAVRIVHCGAPRLRN
ncbi:hypothetical protein [Arthrobacter oryzae]|uniref:hypothetical protein n=1 Tax=Arthrobacter oryzae TaxID=409290 RepID=UPI00273CB17B|nr:hypothetical protein [Arthrobacter oryzae]WLQ07539.1 hypothetical protein Q8Z05_05135 [Arthrobacter oryzae]